MRGGPADGEWIYHKMQSHDWGLLLPRHTGCPGGYVRGGPAPAWAVIWSDDSSRTRNGCRGSHAPAPVPVEEEDG